MNKNKITIITKEISEGRTGYGEAIVDAFCKLEGKKAKITIEHYRRPRTNAQNAYYWCVPLEYYQRYFQQQDVFMTKDEIHEWIKEYVWHDYVDITLINGMEFRKVLSSTDLDTMEWEHRMTLTRNYAATNFNGMQIPEPNEKIDEATLEWLANAEGIYSDFEYKNYFKIPKNKPEQLH